MQNNLAFLFTLLCLEYELKLISEKCQQNLMSWNFILLEETCL